MTVADDSFAPAEMVLRRALDDLDPTPIEWEPALTLVVDNWRILHGRPDTRSGDAGKRRLQRILSG
jgi:alpha-ketoglutarate-dependent taurine dioxygenase